MQPRAVCRSRECSCLIALRDGCCDNDDGLVAAHRSHVLRNICLYGSVSGSRGVARCSRRRSCLFALRDSRCDNDDVTFESIAFSYTSGFNAEYIMGEERSSSRSVARCSRGRSCLAALRDGRRENNDAKLDSFPLLYIEGCVTVIGEAEVAACRLSFERVQLLRYAMR